MVLALAWGAALRAAGEGNAALIEHGRYLAAAADCAGCHTKPPGGATFAGGRPIATPLGVIASTNITPDLETGIGRWTDAQFEAAVREGRRPDGVRLYPVTPHAYYREMTHADVLAIRAYLQTVPAVQSLVKSNRLSFPSDVHASIGAWNSAHFSDESFTVEAQRPTEWHRDAYSVRESGHCAGCHTPQTRY
jgi:mono/diheme cytochrome c family protein